MNHHIKTILVFVLLYTFNFSVVKGQNQSNEPATATEDSLSLNRIIQQVIETHPTVKAAEEALNKADAQINMAKTGYYPNVNISANYSHIGPVPTIDFSSLFSSLGMNIDVPPLSLFPADNFNAGLYISQNIYDFGKTSKSIELANEGKVLTDRP